MAVSNILSFLIELPLDSIGSTITMHKRVAEGLVAEKLGKGVKGQQSGPLDTNGVI